MARNNLKRNKASGLDVLTNAFYQAIWDLLEPHFLKIFLPGTVRKAIMTLILNRTTNNTQKLQAIGLTNCDFKLKAFCVS